MAADMEIDMTADMNIDVVADLDDDGPCIYGPISKVTQLI
jgi:hypothetical protein